MKTNAVVLMLLAVAVAGPVRADDPPAAPAADSSATAPAATTAAAKADAQAEEISSDTDKYLAELDDAIKLAKQGQYGKLPRGSSDRLDALRGTIGELLAGGQDPRALAPDQRLALFNAHQEIESIIKKNDKSRMVCTRETEVGSRVAKTSCMSIGEREERAREAARGTHSMQTNVCTPGPGMACTK
jgi:hypothetical protein